MAGKIDAQKFSKSQGENAKGKWRWLNLQLIKKWRILNLTVGHGEKNFSSPVSRTFQQLFWINSDKILQLPNLTSGNPTLPAELFLLLLLVSSHKISKFSSNMIHRKTTFFQSPWRRRSCGTRIYIDSFKSVEVRKKTWSLQSSVTWDSILHRHFRLLLLLNGWVSTLQFYGIMSQQYWRTKFGLFPESTDINSGSSPRHCGAPCPSWVTS